MNKGSKTYTLIGLGILALVVALVTFVVVGAAQPEPDNPIQTPPQAFATSTMYVAPGEEGPSQGGDEGDSEDSEDPGAEQPDTNQDEQESDQDSDQSGDSKKDGTPKGKGTTGSGGSRGTRTALPGVPSSTSTTTPPVNKPTTTGAPTTVIPGIFTDLGSFATVSSDTKAPDKLSLTRSGWSGLDRKTRKLYFYAIPSNEVGNYSVLVEYVNDETGGKKRTLKGNDGRFGLPIVLSDGAYTTVTLTLVDAKGARTNRTANYRVTYEGRRGPDVSINITDGQRFSTSPVTVRVSAKDHYDGSQIHSEHIAVTLQSSSGSRTLTHPSGSGTYEYKLDFLREVLEGDDTTFTITVRAWDYSVEQASTTVSRRVVYEHHAQGEVIGQAHIVVDATTVGLGIISTFDIDLHQGYPFPKDLVEGLTAQGIRPEYTGSLNNNFYLSGLSAGGVFAGQNIPDTLKHKIDQDKISFSGAHSSDSLTDHDYTNSAGWLYTVNDDWWPSTSFDGYTPSPNDTIYILYSLAGGKDVGSSSPTANGALPSYCGVWRNGTYEEQHNLSEYTVVHDATCGADGDARYVCSVYGCGAWGSEQGAHANGEKIILSATGQHTWEYDPHNSAEPEDGYDGVRAYVCSVCGATRTETWPWTGGPGGDDPDPPTSTYAVSFDAHGGSGHMDVITAVEGSILTIPACSFTAPEGKVFAEWNTKADGTGVSYDPADTLTLQANVTLYAQWKDGGETQGDDQDASGGGPSGGGVMPSARVLQGSASPVGASSSNRGQASHGAGTYGKGASFDGVGFRRGSVWDMLRYAFDQEGGQQ